MNFTWSCVFVALLAVSVFAGEEDAKNYLQELTDAGVSQETAQTLVNIATQHANDGNDPASSGRVIFQTILDETNAAIAKAPAADQEAYKNFVEDKKNQYEKPEVQNADEE
uniref:Secreted protein n=1 Tax=Caenorhabditis tropicalis TaxID=1561998 RepID=A0A1I7U2P4_9PELO